MPVGKKNPGRTASKAEDSKTLPKKANTAPPKPKLKVSTLKNYESDPEDKDITSEEDSDVYQVSYFFVIIRDMQAKNQMLNNIFL